jgi:hypothetical protein
MNDLQKCATYTEIRQLRGQLSPVQFSVPTNAETIGLLDLSQRDIASIVVDCYRAAIGRTAAKLLVSTLGASVVGLPLTSTRRQPLRMPCRN